MRRQKNALPKGTLTVRIYAVHRDRIKRLKNLLNDGSPQVVEALDTLLEDPERCAKLIKSPDQIAANVTRSLAAKVKTLSAKVDSLEKFVRERPRTEDGKPTSAGQPTVKVKRFRPPKCEARILAEDLLKERKPDGGVLTRAEIEQRIVDTLRVSRNSAQSAATKAVQQERPFNPARITRRRPGISCVDTRLRNRMLRMSKAGKTQKEIAAKFDLCVRTVSYHIGLAKRGVTLARKTSPKGVNREKHPPSDKYVNRMSGESQI